MFHLPYYQKMKKTTQKRTRDEVDNSSLVNLIQETIRAEMNRAATQLDQKFEQQKMEIEEKFKNQMAALLERCFNPMEERLRDGFYENFRSVAENQIQLMENQLDELEGWFKHQTAAISKLRPHDMVVNKTLDETTNFVDSEDLAINVNTGTDGADNTETLVEKFGEIEKKKKDNNPRLTVSKIKYIMVSKL